ncbi:MAG: hypothetical protein NXH73_01120 [Flavobacteriaceae bacterium]|nr:hypothetical protein [Flavobacteriaceae bacterium]
MKKKIEEQLRQLAAEILENKEFSSLEQLQEKTKNLYDALTVQLYLEENQKEPEAKNGAMDSNSYAKRQNDEPKPVEQPKHSDNLAEPLIEKIKDIVAQMPSETHRIDEILEEILPKKTASASELEDFASQYQQTPTFERKEIKISQETIKEEEPKENPKQESKQDVKGDLKPKSLNDRLTKNLQIGLNDRLSLTKHLFNGNADDYNRVISQVTTLNSFREAQNFIETSVKPDYNWQGKEVHVERFIMLIEKRFD